MTRLIEDVSEILSYEEHPMRGLQVKTGILILVFLLFCHNSGVATERIIVGGLDGVDPQDNLNHQPVLMAFSGGGARGLASVGILKAFEERGIPISAIAGTSMGGIIGGLYACGYSASELETIVKNIEYGELFANKPSRSTMFLTQRQEKERHLISLRFDGFRPRIPKALTDAQRITTLLTDLTSRSTYLADGDFTKFPIPFLTLGTDLITGEEVVLDTGSLADAMRATMAFPLAFTGIEYGDRLLMDGGMLRPIPVELARKLASSVSPVIENCYVVAINTTTPLRRKEELITPLDIANQATSIMTADRLRHDIDHADYVITPLLTGINSSDFGLIDSIIATGYRAGLSAADSIIQLRKPTMRAEHLTPVGGTIEGVDIPFDGSVFDRTMSRSDLTERMKQFTVDHNLFRLEAIIEPAQMTDAGRTKSASQIQLHLKAEHALTISDIQINFEGNYSFDDSTLLRVCDFDEELLTKLNLRRALDRIQLHYHNNGFDLADISNIEIDFENSKLTIEVEEGLIQRIDVSNNRITRDWLVRSYFPMKVGQPYSTARASQGIASIYGTDLFDRVTLGLKRGSNGVIVELKVEERPYLQTRIGWHWDDEYGSEEFFEVLTDNAHGVGLEYLAHARYGPDRQRYMAGIKADRIFSSYVTAGLQFYHHRIYRTTYGSDDNPDGIRDEQKTGGYFTAGQQISRLGTVEVGIRFEHLSFEDSRFTGKNSFDLRTISFKSEVERFDRVPFPRKGDRLVARIDFTGKLFGGDVEFTRLYSSYESYFTIGKILNYHPKISVGFSRRGLPPSEQFFIGGLHSFSGFRTHQLAGDKLLLFNQEFRLSLPMKSYFTLRYDIGEVYAGADQIKLRNMRHGFGVSFSLNSPMGPFELGYGISGGDNEQVYFRAGHSF